MSEILNHALAAAHRGWSVFPLQQAGKTPLPGFKWTRGASTDPDQIHRWFSDADLNMGISCGPSGLLVVDEDQPGDLARWCTDHGVTLPATFTVATAHGQHLYFNRGGLDLGNHTPFKEDGYGIDVRGAGGYVVGPGSVHPTGVIYTPTDTSPAAPLPQSLVAYLQAPRTRTAPPPQVPTAPGGRPGDDFEQRATWAEILQPHGWQVHHTDGRETYWTRPGKDDREGWSASTGRAEDRDRLWVFSTSTPFQAETPYTKLGAFAVLNFNGDHSAAARDLRARGYGAPDPVIDLTPHLATVTTLEPHTGQERHEEDEGTSWAPIPLEDVVRGLLDGTRHAPAPTIGTVHNGSALFYPGCVNGVAGDSGCGKTWTALTVCAEEITQGHHVAYFDLEDTPEGIIGRLLDMGTDPQAIIRGFHYARPHDHFDVFAREAVTSMIREHGITLVIIDSTGEALSLQGADPNADEQVAGWFRQMPTYIANQGPAVVLLDHVTKSDPDGMWPIGSQRKRAAINGVQYMQRAVSPFARGKDGRAVLKVAKDRHGHYPPSAKAAELTVSTVGDGVRVQLQAPEKATNDAGEFRPTTLMEKVSRALEAAGVPLTGRQIRDEVSSSRYNVNGAVAALIREGNVVTEPGPRKSIMHSLVRPFRVGDCSREHSTDLADPVGSVSVPRLRDGEHGNTRSPLTTVPTGNTREHSGTLDLERPTPAQCGDPSCGRELITGAAKASGYCAEHRPKAVAS